MIVVQGDDASHCDLPATQARPAGRHGTHEVLAWGNPATLKSTRGQRERAILSDVRRPQLDVELTHGRQAAQGDDEPIAIVVQDPGPHEVDGHPPSRRDAVDRDCEFLRGLRAADGRLAPELQP